MRILFVTSVYAPSVSGITTSIQSFKQELERRGHEVWVLAPAHPGHRDTEAHIFRYVSARNPFVRSYPIPLPLPTPALIGFLARTHFDIVHSQHPFYVGTFARMIAKWNKAPFIFTYHTRYDAPFLQILDNDIAGKILPRAVDYFCERADLVIAPTDYIAHYLAAKRKNINIAVIPSPAPEFPNRSNTPDPYPKKTDTASIRCLMVQRLTFEKKTDFAVEMIAKLPRQYHLYIAGDGPARKKLEELAHSLGIGERVHLLGFKTRADLAGFFKYADMFLFTSTTETQSMGILEAASWALPMVVVDSEFSRSVIPNSVCVRAPLHTELFAKAVFLAHRNREIFGVRAKRWAEEFSVARCADLLEERYRIALEIRRLTETGWQSWSLATRFSFGSPLHRFNPLRKDNYAVPAEVWKKPKRRQAKAITGWNSWGAYGRDINEEKILSHAFWMHEHREKIPLEYCVIDDGWNKWGDWLTPSREKFPHGLKYTVSQIHARGLRAGIWIAPFLASPNASLVRQFPDWFARDGDGLPVDGMRYHQFSDMPLSRPLVKRLLDARNSDVRAYLRASIDFLLKTCGFDLIKLDFLFAPYFIPGISAHDASELVQWLLNYVRMNYPDVYVIGSMSPLVDSVGLVDAMRVGPDSVMPLLRDGGRVAAFAHALRLRAVDRIVRMRMWTAQYWMIDPDVFVCDSGYSIGRRDILRMRALIHDCHGLKFLGDDLTQLTEQEMRDFIEPLFAERGRKPARSSHFRKS